MTVAFRRYPVCLPVYLFVCLSWTENAYRNNIIMHTHTQPLEWTGGWRILGSGRRLLCLILFVVRAYFKGERERGSVCSFSILYRISLFPFPFAVVSFKKFSVGSVLFFPCIASPYMPSYFLRLASRFAHCSGKETSRPVVVPYPNRIVSCYIKT